LTPSCQKIPAALERVADAIVRSDSRDRSPEMQKRVTEAIQLALLKRGLAPLDRNERT